jgi:hypothetical protein
MPRATHANNAYDDYISRQGDLQGTGSACAFFTDIVRGVPVMKRFIITSVGSQIPIRFFKFQWGFSDHINGSEMVGGTAQ